VYVRQITIMIFFCALSAYTQTTLSGNIAGTTFEQSGNPFIITDNLTIPEGKTVTIKEGCVFLFKPFTGMNVEGSLKVDGTLENPVVFSTVNDGKYNPKAEQLPNPFDWNGILISAKANQISLSNFIVAYTVYGIKSMKQDFTISNGTFVQNGQFHLTVNESIKPVNDGIPYSYGTKQKPKNGEASFVKNNLPIILGSTGVACGVGTIVSTIVFFKTRNDYLAEDDPVKLTKGRTALQNVFAGTVVFGAATAVLVPSAIVVNNNRKAGNKKTVFEINPQYHDGPGITLGIRF
jgi:hypothetical protein